MAFRFPLESVFHFRRSVEHQQELRLRAANQQVARVHHLLEQLDERLRQLQIRQREQLSSGTTAAELQFTLTSEQTLHQQRQVLEQELVRLQQIRDRQRKIYEQARRERETFESLREHQRRDYEREQRRRDQRELDDLFLLRQSYLQRG